MHDILDEVMRIKRALVLRTALQDEEKNESKIEKDAGRRRSARVVETDARFMHLYQKRVGDMHNDAPYVAARANDRTTLCISVVHPRRYPVPSEPCCEPQTGRAHGKVADGIPYKANKLDDGRDKREDGAVQLDVSRGPN